MYKLKNIKCHRTKIDENIKKWKKKTFQVHVKVKVVLPKEIYRFNAIFIKSLKLFFKNLEKILLKFLWNYRNSPTNLEILK